MNLNDIPHERVFFLTLYRKNKIHFIAALRTINIAVTVFSPRKSGVSAFDHVLQRTGALTRPTSTFGSEIIKKLRACYCRTTSAKNEKQGLRLRNRLEFTLKNHFSHYKNQNLFNLC